MKMNPPFKPLLAGMALALAMLSAPTVLAKEAPLPAKQHDAAKGSAQGVPPGSGLAGKPASQQTATHTAKHTAKKKRRPTNKPTTPPKSLQKGKPTSQGAASHGTGGAARHGGAQAVPGVNRDANGTIARSSRQKAAFRESHPCPSTGKHSGPCPGYVVDHKTALKHGGADTPQNMQWQSKDAARAKDQRE